MNAISPVIQPVANDEVDLIALFHTPWEQKLLITLLTLLVGMLAAAYTFLAESQVQSVLCPALIKDRDALNVLRKNHE